MQKFLITFAGVPGSSKTPIAHFLSCQFKLPVFSNDAIRRETLEDIDMIQGIEEFKNQHAEEFEDKWIKEFRNRSESRLNKMIASGNNFIYDASVDRKWAKIREMMLKNNYRWFIISLDLSEDFLEKLQKIKAFSYPLEAYLDDHFTFLKNYSEDINLSITDDNFKDRLELSANKVKEWIDNII